MAPDRKPLASTSAAELTGNTIPEPLEPKKQKKLPSCDSCKLRRGECRLMGGLVDDRLERMYSLAPSLAQCYAYLNPRPCPVRAV